MSWKLEKQMQEVVKEVFGENLDERLFVALVFTLNYYDIYTTELFPSKDKGHIEFTFESVFYILSDFKIDGEIYKPAELRWKYIENYKLLTEKSFDELVEDVVKKLEKHTWILGLKE